MYERFLLILQLEAEYFLNDAKTSFGVATKSIRMCWHAGCGIPL